MHVKPYEDMHYIYTTLYMFSEEIEYGKFCFLMRSAVFRDKISS